jgi:hypothetical protein
MGPPRFSDINIRACPNFGIEPFFANTDARTFGVVGKGSFELGISTLLNNYFLIIKSFELARTLGLNPFTPTPMLI